MIACQDCLYYCKGYRTARCNAPQLMIEFDYEMGVMCRKQGEPERPHTIRSRETMCGPEARWFVRATWLDRLLRRF